MTTKATSVPPSHLKIWLMASRPATLPAAVVPVLVGSALAYSSDAFQPLVMLAALLGALFIQIGTNLANDYFDAQKGADTSERLGPVRVTQSGLLPARTVLTAALVSFGLAALAGIYLITVAGWPILVIGLLSIAAGILYTAGPFPLGYHGLGDLFTFVFFGLVAVIGTDFAHTGQFRWIALWAALPIAMLVTAILVVNNLRDAPTDRKAGKRTLAVIFGERFARSEFAILVIGAFVSLPLAWMWGGASPFTLLAWLTAPMALNLIDFVNRERGRALNKALVGAGRLHLAFGVLFAIGLLFG
ncbi:MAG TPA: 1,4-dihydroxy-2-naphthoate polyprenyltransferase [Chloroflexus aurantiacus]|uniref:1,4-dihydroxy-2-naphthoate octaprenyltransferase n=1 Tax=Chloroflexus aurantiacus (strain ATCC 29366 / DSM 635 / J-10-fl) TaxID=324602 RepID=A9WBE2_CHLAA|nr:1,4-dihydroxy-2-naphthoate polyprenyltransferase [Chloroflexus aurantiacus]ABY33349.1 1,4-dihydroxy-2-naphthoate octaprenyltransferase [Chloroflexus aurantiacus J-10-fl]GIV92992.1 MAG: 1,4-dihydroxy-2-naphthoate octaprenyltransferase [Chloroflexus sp.]HBW66796.1 1,4-dihydroxy-2-naphthoate polyprenyltransferase [Chloroflexus aurantiacus]